MLKNYILFIFVFKIIKFYITLTAYYVSFCGLYGFYKLIRLGGVGELLNGFLFATFIFLIKVLAATCMC